MLAAGAPKIIQMTFGLQVSNLLIKCSVCVGVDVGVGGWVGGFASVYSFI